MKTMNPNNLGKKFLLVEECQKISIIPFLKRAKNKLKEALIFSEIDVNGLAIKLAISKTGFNGVRYWFECPLCRARVGVLYIHPLNQQLGCRVCLGLEYRKRRYKGMIENSIG